MAIETNRGIEISNGLVENYMDGLINQFFKILPLKENGESSLLQYMESLVVELLGNKTLILKLNNDSRYLSLIAILEYLINYNCEVKVVKREVFKAIDLCKKLRIKYGGDDDERME